MDYKSDKKELLLINNALNDIAKKTDMEYALIVRDKTTGTQFFSMAAGNKTVKDFGNALEKAKNKHRI
jgi:hypothetical protein